MSSYERPDALDDLNVLERLTADLIAMRERAGALRKRTTDHFVAGELRGGTRAEINAYLKSVEEIVRLAFINVDVIAKTRAAEVAVAALSRKDRDEAKEASLRA